MNSVNMHEVEIHLCQLVARVQNGETFVIYESGKPIARLIAIDAPEFTPQKRLGFLKGQFKIPDDFDRMGE